jgi:hypothetical protein
MQIVLPLRIELGDAADIMSFMVHDYIFVRCFRVEKCKKKKKGNRRVKGIDSMKRERGGPKEGQQDWSHLAQELTPETCCAWKHRREEKTKKKT